MKNLRQVTIKKQNLFQPVLNNFVPIPLFCEKSNLCETEIHLCFWLYDPYLYSNKFRYQADIGNLIAVTSQHIGIVSGVIQKYFSDGLKRRSTSIGNLTQFFISGGTWASKMRSPFE